MQIKKFGIHHREINVQFGNPLQFECLSTVGRLLKLTQVGAALSNYLYGTHTFKATKIVKSKIK